MASVEETEYSRNSRAVALHVGLRTGLRVAMNTPDPPILEKSLFQEGEDNGGKPRRSQLSHLPLGGSPAGQGSPLGSHPAVL